MQMQQIHDLMGKLKTKGMQVELFKRPRKYSSVVYDIRNERGIIIKSEEVLANDFDEIMFDKYRKALRRTGEFIKSVQFGCINKTSEIYLLKDEAGIQIGWFDLENGRKGIADAIIALRAACLKYGVRFTPDIPSDEPFPHTDYTKSTRKRAKIQ